MADTQFESRSKTPLRQRFAWTLAANTLIPKGTYAMNDAGVIKRCVSPAPAGAVVLGRAESDYDNLGNMSNKTFTLAEGPMVFSYGELTVLVKQGDEPDDTFLGKPVFFQDERTVGKTNAGTDTNAVWGGSFNNQYWIDVK